jgi:hypothetical protein
MGDQGVSKTTRRRQTMELPEIVSEEERKRTGNK